RGPALLRVDRLNAQQLHGDLPVARGADLTRAEGLLRAPVVRRVPVGVRVERLPQPGGDLLPALAHRLRQLQPGRYRERLEDVAERLEDLVVQVRRELERADIRIAPLLRNRRRGAGRRPLAGVLRGTRRL